MTEAPIFSRARGPPGGKADYRLLDRWTEGASLRRRPWAGAGPRLRHARIQSSALSPDTWGTSAGPLPSASSHCPVPVPGVTVGAVGDEKAA